MPAPGTKIPLTLKLFDNATDKFVLVKVYDDVGAHLSGSPLILTHFADGFYFDNSITMPDLAEVVAVYQVFDNALLTVHAAGYQDSTDIFYRDSGGLIQTDLSDIKGVGWNASYDALHQIRGAIDNLNVMSVNGDATILGELQENAILEARISQDDEIFIEVDQRGELLAEISTAELSGTIYQSGELVGQVEDDVE